MFTHLLPVGWSSGNNQIAQQVSKQADGERNADPVVPAESADLVVAFPIAFAALKLLTIFTDRDITIATDDVETSTNTPIVLLAGNPLIWWDGCPFANPFDTDFSTLHIVNAGLVDANVQIRALVDATP